jgi:DNA modification methylase
VSVQIITGDCRDVLRALPDESVHCVVTSPPYFGLRDYGVAGQIGLEPTPDEFVAEMVGVFRDVRRVLRDDGTLWLNLGDSYASDPRKGRVTATQSGKAAYLAGQANQCRFIGGSLKPKDLIGIPWRVAFALQADGWYLRSDIVWHKPNPMPESVTDRPTSAHEHVFLLAKSERYFYDAEAVRERAVSDDDKKWTDGGSEKQRGHGRRHAGFNGRYAERIAIDGAPTHRNLRNVWTIATRPFPEAHFATFPPDLAERCIEAGCPAGGTILDPFGGAGTTGLVADRLGRNAILIELNPEYADMARRRIKGDAPLFAQVSANDNYAAKAAA